MTLVASSAPAHHASSELSGGMAMLLQQAAVPVTDASDSGLTFKTMLAQANQSRGLPDNRPAKADKTAADSIALPSGLKRPKTSAEEGDPSADVIPGMLPAAATADYATVATVAPLPATAIDAAAPATPSPETPLFPLPALPALPMAEDDLATPPGTLAGDAIDSALANDPAVAVDPFLVPVAASASAALPTSAHPAAPTVIETASPIIDAASAAIPGDSTATPVRSMPAAISSPALTVDDAKAAASETLPVAVPAAIASSSVSVSPAAPVPSASVPQAAEDEATGDDVPEAAAPQNAIPAPVSQNAGVSVSATAGETDEATSADADVTLSGGMPGHSRVAKSGLSGQGLSFLAEKNAASPLTARLPETRTISADANGIAATPLSAMDDASASTDTGPATTAVTAAADGSTVFPGFALRPADPAQNQPVPLVQVTVTPSQPLAEQVNVHIRTAAEGGLDRIRIQLHPEDMGSVEVSISIARDKSAAVHITANRQETLDTLQRHAQSLTRALGEAGIKAEGQSLQFELSGGGSRQASAQSGNEQKKPGAQAPASKDEPAEQAAPARSADHTMARLVTTTGINIRV